MPSIPLPFVVSFVLCLVLIRMGRRNQGPWGAFRLFVALCALQAVLSGLHWTVGWQSVRLLQPILAGALPPLAFIAFAQLRLGTGATVAQIAPQLVPVVIVAALVVVWRAPIDATLFAIYLGYGIALLRDARAGPDGLAATRLGDAPLAHRALTGLAGLFILTAFIDAGVSLALTYGTKRLALTILTVASTLWLAAAGYAATVADATRPDGEEAEPATPPITTAAPTGKPDTPDAPSQADAAIMSLIETLMTEQTLYRDPDLTLDRLARRAGLPARQISGALNRVRGCNVSQVINAYRIGDAQRRLASTTDPVTAIMLDVGFGTKSNFNREFLRVTGMTPSEYRRSGGNGPEPQEGGGPQALF